ncbi:MAG: transcriptional regulator [Cereibacter sphaeroides]|uniref:Transcriptional regulator n=1 Tax=Cereibacter sphaeroides TaxID=1063 RepID=A0A2W5S4R8_CERSP|nr:MAG: transcriptional regulator [Cereibacter sphaeroides]
MGRTRTIPDTVVFAEIRRLLAEGGEKAVAFSTVARVTGLAAPTLVQRYGSRDAMLRAALMAAWDSLEATTAEAADAAALTAKGAGQFLKMLSVAPSETADLTLLGADFRDADLRDRALRWRETVEENLAARLGGGSKGREAATILFAAWQGQALWSLAGGRGFKVKDAVKRLS